jgi:hypothetical protein
MDYTLNPIRSNSLFWFSAGRNFQITFETTLSTNETERAFATKPIKYALGDI